MNRLSFTSAGVLLALWLCSGIDAQEAPRPEVKQAPTAADAVKDRLKKYEPELLKIRTAMLKEVDDELKKIDEAIKVAETAVANAKNDADARMKAFREMARQRSERIRVQTLRYEVERMVPARGPSRRPPLSGEQRLGISASSLSSALLAQLKLDKGAGMVVNRVEAKSPAAAAGLQANDILVKIDGKPAAGDSLALRKQLDEIKPDTPFDVVVLRQGKEKPIARVVIPGDMPR